MTDAVCADRQLLIALDSALTTGNAAGLGLAMALSSHDGLRAVHARVVVGARLR